MVSLTNLLPCLCQPPPTPPPTPKNPSHQAHSVNGVLCLLLFGASGSVFDLTCNQVKIP